MASTPSDNKRIVREFYELAFNQHKVAEAVEKYLGQPYIQHNPNGRDGADYLVARFEPYFKENPDAHVDIKRALAEDDLVALHLNWKRSKSDPGRAIVDIFKLEDGKIIEHWDVIQPVAPQRNGSGHSMF